MKYQSLPGFGLKHVMTPSPTKSSREQLRGKGKDDGKENPGMITLDSGYECCISTLVRVAEDRGWWQNLITDASFMTPLPLKLQDEMMGH